MWGGGGTAPSRSTAPHSRLRSEVSISSILHLAKGYGVLFSLFFFFLVVVKDVTLFLHSHEMFGFTGGTAKGAVLPSTG